MPLLGKQGSLTKEELVIFCKSFNKDIICNDMIAYMNEKEGSNSARDFLLSPKEKNKDIDLEANMTFFDPYFVTWFKNEKGIA